jgi:dCMP deaminase
MSENLIAYIPTLNQRHLDWFKKHPDSRLFLITEKMAGALLPRLHRNMAALPSYMVAKMIEAAGVVQSVMLFDPEDDDPQLNHSSGIWHNWIVADEDISRLVSEKYLVPANCSVVYESIWARWDMQAVHQSQPVIADVDISADEFDVDIMKKLRILSDQSPDWWRRVAAGIVNADGRVIATAYNTHMPNEYETYIFGDPALNRDAGEKGKSCVIHAEQAAIIDCARLGFALLGAKIYVTTFPCEMCAREIAHSGIREVYFAEGYSSLNAQEVLRSRGVRIVQVKHYLVPVLP